MKKSNTVLIGFFLLSVLPAVAFCDSWKSVLFTEKFDSVTAMRDNSWDTKGDMHGVEGVFNSGIEFFENATASNTLPGIIDSETGTIEFWFNPSFSLKNGEKSIGLFGIGEAGLANSIFLNISQLSGKHAIIMEIRDSSNKLSQSRSAIVTIAENKWHHVALTWKCNQKDNYIKVFLDGKAGATKKSACITFNLQGNIVIGNNNSNTDSKKFSIDDLRIYGYIKSSGQIAKDYKYKNDSQVPEIITPTQEKGMKDSANFIWWSNNFTKFKIEVSQKEDFSNPKAMTGWITAASTNLQKAWKTILSMEKSDTDKILFWRIVGTRQNDTEYSNAASFRILPPEAPVLQCPAREIRQDYSFSWTSGDYSSIYLQIGYDPSFKTKTFVQITDKESPTEIAKYANNLTVFMTKTKDSKLRARIFAKDNYDRTEYSNVCEFGLDFQVVCYKNSDCGTAGPAGEQYCSSGKIYLDNITFACNNSGKINSYCSSKTEKKVIETCKFGCNGNICAQDPGDVLKITFDTFPSTIKTNMKFFPVIGSADRGTPVKINGENPDFNKFDDYFTVVELELGNNAIKVEKTQGEKKLTIIKNVQYDPDYSTERIELIYTTIENWLYPEPNRYDLFVMDNSNNTYLGIMKDTFAWGMSPDGKTVIATVEGGKKIAIDTSTNNATEISMEDIPTNKYFEAIKYSRDGSKIYSGKSIIDAKTFQKIGTISSTNNIELNDFISWDDTKIFYREDEYSIGYYSLPETKYYSRKYSQFSYYDWTGFGTTKDDKYLISTGCSWWEGYIDIFEVATGKNVKHFGGIADCPAGIAIKEDGKTAYLSFTGSTDGNYGYGGLFVLDLATLSKKSFINNSGLSDQITLTTNNELITDGSVPNDFTEGIVLFKINSNSLEAKKVFMTYSYNTAENIYYKKAS